jgi:hypothetical protein
MFLSVGIVSVCLVAPGQPPVNVEWSMTGSLLTLHWDPVVATETESPVTGYMVQPEMEIASILTRLPSCFGRIMKQVQQRLAVREFDSQPADRFLVHISNCLWAALSKNPYMILNNV